jgi:hypothetical protein
MMSHTHMYLYTLLVVSEIKSDQFDSNFTKYFLADDGVFSTARASLVLPRYCSLLGHPAIRINVPNVTAASVWRRDRDRRIAISGLLRESLNTMSLIMFINIKM